MENKVLRGVYEKPEFLFCGWQFSGVRPKIAIHIYKNDMHSLENEA
jgi:hypothetical protein